MKTMRIISHALAAIALTIAVSAVTGCSQPTDEELDSGPGGGPLSPALSGNVTVFPRGSVPVGTELTATYSGTEAVSFTWKRNGVAITTEANCTADTIGRYTVTVSADGFADKTSTDVFVYGEPEEADGATLALKLRWLELYARSDCAYLLEVEDNERLEPQTLAYLNRTNVVVILKGRPDGAGAAEKTISLEKNGCLFTVGNGVTLILDENITLKGHNGNNASLVRVTAYGSLEMRDGAKIIDNNYTSPLSNGGGVYVGSIGSFTMNGGEITNNKSTAQGGGVYVYGRTNLPGGILVINGGSITTNASPTTGGGVYIGSTASLIMEGGDISGNTASSGAGVYADGSAVFTMNGGEITDNTATTGGGVFVNNTASFTMSGGEIKENTTPGAGAGVYADGSAALTMTGGAIHDNTATSGGGGVLVKNTASFTMSGGEINKNTSAMAGGGLRIEGAGSTFTMEGGEISDNVASSLGGGVYAADNTFFTMSGGEISRNIGTRGGGVCVAFATFTMSGGEIKENKLSPNGDFGGGGVFVNSASFTMTGGAIYGNTCTRSGAGVCAEGGASAFTMEGGEIYGNTAPRDAGGVYVSGAGVTFIMNGGKIYNNTGRYGGGVSTSTATIIMNDGEIYGNTATGTNPMGGGVGIWGNFIMNGGKIYGNTTTGSGGGVCAADGTFRIVTGTIYGSNETDSDLKNSAASSGSAALIYSVAQRGTYSGEDGAWVSKGNLATTNNTLKVENGEIVQ